MRGVVRVAGIFAGALLGWAVGSNGTLIQNPYYVCGMLVLLVALFSLPAAVAEMRYSLTMCAYTAVAVAGCSYVGCCDAGAITSQDFAAKASRGGGFGWALFGLAIG